MDTCTINDVYLYLGSDAPANPCIIPDVRAIEIVDADIDHPSLVSYPGSVTLAWPSITGAGMDTFSFVPRLDALEATFNDITASSAPVKISSTTAANCWTVVVDGTIRDASNFFERVLRVPSTIDGVMPGTYVGYTTTTTAANPPNGYWLPPPSRGIGVVLQLGGHTVSAFEGTAFQGCAYVDTPNARNSTPIPRTRIPVLANGKAVTIRGISGYLQYADKHPCSAEWSLIIRCIRE